MDRRTEEPQRTHSTAANAEYKASAGIGDVIHGADSEVRRYTTLRLLLISYYRDHKSTDPIRQQTCRT